MQSQHRGEFVIPTTAAQPNCSCQMQCCNLSSGSSCQIWHTSLSESCKAIQLPSACIVLGHWHCHESQRFTYGIVREEVIADNFPEISAKFRFPQNLSAQFTCISQISANFPQNFRKKKTSSELLNGGEGWAKSTIAVLV